MDVSLEVPSPPCRVRVAINGGSPQAMPHGTYRVRLYAGAHSFRIENMDREALSEFRLWLEPGLREHHEVVRLH